MSSNNPNSNKLPRSKERSSASSTGSIGSTGSAHITTTFSESKDPIDFLKTKGYKVLGTLGEGSFAKVYRASIDCKCANPGANSNDANGMHTHTRAIKVFNLSEPGNQIWADKCLRNEMFVSMHLKHPNVVISYDVFKTHRHAYIVMRFAANGSIKSDLFERLKRPYKNDEAKQNFKGLMAGLQYMHAHNVAHRDLKLENFLISAEKVPMLADFGFAARVKVANNVPLTQMMKKTICGTKGYMAPELYPKVKASATGESNPKLGKDYQYDAKKVDIFAMGVSLFEMFNLSKPFKDEMNAGSMRKVIAQEIKYHNKDVEDACKELIGAMLRMEAHERLTADDILKHRWLCFGTVINAVTSWMNKIGN